MTPDETASLGSTDPDDAPRDARARAAIPGVVMIFSAGRPTLRAVPVVGREVAIGRETPGLGLDDPRVSRRHAAVAREGDRWVVRDLGSRNGTFVDGARVDGAVTARDEAVVRVGGTLLVLKTDARIYFDAGVHHEGDATAGPAWRAALARIERAARAGRDAVVIAETGAGKELAARAFHAAARPEGPLVAVNCATIPAGVAERLLFGALRGTFSGATADSVGYVEAAHGGTLFLDEVAELDADVQAKLLRVLDTREVLPLGGLRARRVDFRVICATHRDLRARIESGHFRADLYFRLAQAEVSLPPLRARREEIPWLAARAVGEVDRALALDVALVESLALHPWPGNVRELLTVTRQCAHAALDEGASLVSEAHLTTPLARAAPPPAREGSPTRAAEPITEDAVRAALDASDGNVAAAARALGAQRTQMYRWLARFGIDPKRPREP